MCILELSKVQIYEFHYEFIKNKYDIKSKLLFIDTESLMYGMELKMLMTILGGIKKWLIIVIILVS